MKKSVFLHIHHYGDTGQGPAGYTVWKQAANHNIVLPQPQNHELLNRVGDGGSGETHPRHHFIFFVRDATAQKDVDHSVGVGGKVNTVVLDVTAKSAQTVRE